MRTVHTCSPKASATGASTPTLSSAEGAARMTFCMANIAVFWFAPPPVRSEVQTEYGAHRALHNHTTSQAGTQRE